MGAYLILSIVVIFAVVLSFALYFTIFQPFPKAGKIIEKRHQTKRSFLQLIPTIKSTGMIFMPSVISKNEDWIIVIEDQDGLQGEVYVDKPLWDSLTIDQNFTVFPDSEV